MLDTQPVTTGREGGAVPAFREDTHQKYKCVGQGTYPLPLDHENIAESAFGIYLASFPLIVQNRLQNKSNIHGL